MPPNRFRIRVGVGNRLLFNQPQFLTHGADLAIRIFGLGLARCDSNIVEIGAGCGRLAFTLKHADAFVGGYTGTDVDKEMIDWCDEHLGDNRFRFLHSDVYNALYNPTGSRQPLAIPLQDGSQQLVMSHSLFTHLLEEDVRRCMQEAHRLLDAGGFMAMTVFCLDHMRSSGHLGGRWTFPNPMGNARVESLDYPEAAVAYDRTYLEAAALDAGFQNVRIAPSPSGHDPQSLLICRS